MLLKEIREKFKPEDFDLFLQFTTPKGNPVFLLVKDQEITFIKCEEDLTDEDALLYLAKTAMYLRDIARAGLEKELFNKRG